MFKAFSDSDIVPISFDNRQNLSISTGSPTATHVHFFTGIRSLGKISFFDVDTPPSFGLTLTKELKYQFLFDKSTVPGSSLTAERTSGIFLSAPDQEFKSSSNNAATASHQSIFNYTHGYLYRNDNSYVAGITALQSTSTASSISVIRLITLRRDLFRSSIEPNSVRMEMNLSNTSATGIVAGASTGLVTALDLKNPFGGDIGTTDKSFFGVPWAESTSLDTATSGLTIEAIIRPYKENSVILWRRLSSEAWAGATVETQNSFLKLELTKSADNVQNAFRFYIRSVTANDTFSEDFAKNDIQASGLFIPSDVGINLFDGRFHHLIVSWGISGVDKSTTIESGAGAVFGYIDGFKLLNKEQVDPRRGGADSAGGPVIQANMFEQRIPIRTSAIEYVDTQDASPSGNNLYFGISNFNRDGKEDTIGDRGSLLNANNPRIEGGFDGQIQHIRIWNQRFTDGTTGIKQSVEKIVNATSSAGLSFNNFKDNSLTGTLGTNLIGWWNFNKRNTITAADVSQNSNTGSLIGESKIELFDYTDFTVTAQGNTIVDTSLSANPRTYLYIDIPENNVIDNDLKQGRIIRRAADGTQIRVGIIYYDLGVIVLDADDTNARMNFLWPASGTTGDFGFSVTGTNNAALNVERFVFNSIDNRGRLLLNAVGEGNEFNFTENPAGVDVESGGTILDEPAGYITSVGLYNDTGELVAIGKLSVPVRKDETSKVEIQTKLDF